MRMNAMQAAMRRYGSWAAARQARNLGISFEDAYIGFFGREPRKV